MHLERAYCVWSILWLYNADIDENDVIQNAIELKYLLILRLKKHLNLQQQ